MGLRRLQVRDGHQVRIGKTLKQREHIKASYSIKVTDYMDFSARGSVKGTPLSPM